MAGPADGPSPAVRRYLLESERLEFAVRRHWVAVVGAASRYLLAVVGSLAVLGVAGRTPAGSLVGTAVLLVATAWFGWRLGDWWTERFTVTDRRVLLVSGLLTRRVAIMPLRKVTDITYERTVPGRLLGYGAFVMESAGQHQALSRIDYLPDPESRYRQMSQLLFGSVRSSFDPDEDELPSGPPPWEREPRVGRPAPAPFDPDSPNTAPLPVVSGRPATARVPQGRRQHLG